jgi:hypothetical protein
MSSHPNNRQRSNGIFGDSQQYYEECADLTVFGNKSLFPANKVNVAQMEERMAYTPYVLPSNVRGALIDSIHNGTDPQLNEFVGNWFPDGYAQFGIFFLKISESYIQESICQGSNTSRGLL